MYFYHDKIEKIDMGEGVIRQDLAHGENMNVLHWNMADGSEVKWHSHTQEQFGYVIKGGFEMDVDGDKTILKAGDAYVIPANKFHSFVAIGETEAIDVFSPLKKDFPWKG